jgi:hypothetical protein
MEREEMTVERWCVVCLGFGDFDVVLERVAKGMHVCGTFENKKRAEAHAMFLDARSIKRWR